MNVGALINWGYETSSQKIFEIVNSMAKVDEKIDNMYTGSSQKMIEIANSMAKVDEKIDNLYEILEQKIT